MRRRGRGVPRPVGRPTVPRRLNIARAGTLLVAVEVLNVFVGFASTVYFARALGATQLGIFFLFQAAVATLATVADFGLRGAVEKRLTEGEREGALLGAGVALKIGLFALVGVAVWVARDPLAGYIGADLTILLLVTTALYEFSALTMHVLRAELRAAETAVLYFLRLLTYVAIGVPLIAAGYGVRGLVAGLAASYLVLLLGGLLRVSTPLARPGLAEVRSLVGYAKYNGVWALGGYVYTTMDVLVVGYFLSQAAVGAYQLAWNVTAMTAVVAGVLANTLFAQLSIWNVEGESERVRETVRDALTVSLAVGIPSFFGVLVLSGDILSVVFGPEYAIAGLAFVVLMAEKLVGGPNQILDATVRAFDRPDVGAFATAGSLTANVVLNVLLVPRFGLAGAAAATGLAMALNTAVLAGALTRFMTVSIAWREVAWCGVAGVLMAATLVGLGRVVSPSSLPTLVGYVVLGGAVYGGVVAVSPTLRAKGIEMARTVV